MAPAAVVILGGVALALGILASGIMLMQWYEGQWELQAMLEGPHAPRGRRRERERQNRSPDKGSRRRDRRESVGPEEQEMVDAKRAWGVPAATGEGELRRRVTTGAPPSEAGAVDEQGYIRRDSPSYGFSAEGAVLSAPPVVVQEVHTGTAPSPPPPSSPLVPSSEQRSASPLGSPFAEPAAPLAQSHHPASPLPPSDADYSVPSSPVGVVPLTTSDTAPSRPLARSRTASESAMSATSADTDWTGVGSEERDGAGGAGRGAALRVDESVLTVRGGAETPTPRSADRPGSADMGASQLSAGMGGAHDSDEGSDGEWSAVEGDGRRARA